VFRPFVLSVELYNIRDFAIKSIISPAVFPFFEKSSCHDTPAGSLMGAGRIFTRNLWKTGAGSPVFGG
jgi:hypothetical protein